MLLVKHLEHVWIKFDIVAMDHDVIQIWNENLTVELLEAVKHGEEHVFHVRETAARAWPPTRVRTIPHLAVLMDEMTASANKSTRRPLLENGLLVPVTGLISAGPCGRH